MLATSGTGKPPRGRAWLHEIKWDGVRCILSVDEGLVWLRSRRGNDMAASYPEIAAAARDLGPRLILDGEIVALDTAGVPSFERLQARMNLSVPRLVADAVQSVPVTYVVFDLLHRGESLLAMPLEDRIGRLHGIVLPSQFVLSETYGEPGPVWDFALERGLEGVVSKRRTSSYRPGVRSGDWVKNVTYRSVSAVVGGFTEGEGGRLGGFGALVLGLWKDDKLRWIGSVGSGFSESDVRQIRSALDEMTIDESPFHDDDQMPGKIVWVAPALVAVVQYRQWTVAGRLRGPSFKGFSDLPIADATWEAEGPAAPGG